MALHRWLRGLGSTLLLGAAALASAAPSSEEHLRIQALIHRVEKMSSMRFLRNGTAHSAAEAAEHMQAKYAYFKDKIATAEDFVDLCASRSEMTRQPYMVKIGDAAPVEAASFLKDELRTLRKAPAP